jgi:hypothetical protein
MKLNLLNFRELELRDFQGGKTMKKKALNFNTRNNWNNDKTKKMLVS